MRVSTPWGGGVRRGDFWGMDILGSWMRGSTPGGGGVKISNLGTCGATITRNEMLPG